AYHRQSSLGADAKLGKFFETDEVRLDGLGNKDRARFVAMTTSDTGDKASSSAAKPTASTSSSTSATTSSSSIPKSKPVETFSAAKPITSTSTSASTASTSSTSNSKSKAAAANPCAASSASTPPISILKSKSLEASSAATPAHASSASIPSTSILKNKSVEMSSAKPTTSTLASTSSSSIPKSKLVEVSSGAKPTTSTSAATSSTSNPKSKSSAGKFSFNPTHFDPQSQVALSLFGCETQPCELSIDLMYFQLQKQVRSYAFKKACRMSSPLPSPSERTATPHAPVRPETVRASLPLESSQLRLSLTPPPSTQPRGTKCAWAVNVKDELDSPVSSASMEAISLALAADAGSSPVKSAVRKKGKISLPTSRPYVEISVPRKRARMSGGTQDDKQSHRLALLSSQGPVSVSAVERGLGKKKGKEKEKNYIVCLPDDCEGYMVRTMELCSRVASGNQEELWVELAAAYVALEVVRNYKPRKLDTNGRPDVIAQWIKHARSPRYHPPIKLSSFKSGFQRWWWNIAPDWRRMDGEDAALLHGDGDWTVLYNTSTGPNGMSSVMAALAWWLDEVEGLPTGNPRECQLKEEELEDWVESTRDVLWSYNKMLKL
ncbi:hypothetical protein V5O48_012754, partial [Marasmius crinis-equi]